MDSFRCRVWLLAVTLLGFGSLAHAGINQWTSNGPEGGVVQTVAIDPLTPTILYAGTTSNGIFKSMDGGATWTPINSGLTDLFVEVLAVDPVTPTTLYAGTGGAVFKSVDGGATWSHTGFSFLGSASALVIDPTNPQVLYVTPGAFSQGASISRSTDDGENWVLSSFPAAIRALVIDPTHPATLYAGVIGDVDEPSVFRSTDGGATWISMSNGLPRAYLNALVIDPITGSMLYAGTQGAGAYDFQITDSRRTEIVAHLESPEAGPVSGIAVIRGWAFATQEEEQIRSIELFIDGTRSGDIPCCSQRGDVQAAFPQFPSDNTLNSGWGVVFNWGFLSPGTHTVQVRIEDTSGAVFFSDVRTVLVVKPGNAEFLDQFDLSRATVRIEGDELVAEGITVRDKATQQQRVINARFRWFEHSQSFGMVQASIVAELTSWRSLASAFFARLPAWFVSGPVSALAQDGFPAIAAMFESPTEGQVVSGIGIIRGWSFSDRGSVPIGLVVDEQASGLIPCCSERADVAAAFPDNPHALNSGWGTVFNYGLLTAGLHTIGVNVAYYGYSGPIDRHTVTVVKPGGFEFLDQFDFSAAQAMIPHPWSAGMQLAGVQVRDKATQQTRVVDVELRWFEHSQALGIVAAGE